MSPEEFRQAGYRLVDRLAAFLEALPDLPVTPGATPGEMNRLLPPDTPLPGNGEDPERILDRTVDLLTKHSSFNGHPRFLAYITSSPAPIGVLGEFLAACMNPNVGAWIGSPAATQIEAQTIQWLASLIGYPSGCAGLFVSGGNVANLTCFIAARTAQVGDKLRSAGLAGTTGGRLRCYAAGETHTWIQKAADICGLGTDAIRWIGVDRDQRMRVEELGAQIEQDLQAGDRPFLVVGNAGTVSTGAIDPLQDLATICAEHNLWFHVDGAYGGFAAAVPEIAANMRGLERADSIAIDPHKWLYAPLEAGCALVRDPRNLREAFSYHPPYYTFDPRAINYVDLGLQNSRGFRALKVWLALQHVGREGYVRMIRDDIALARAFFDLATERDDLEPLAHSLSITAFRYVPPDLKTRVGEAPVGSYLNSLNQRLRDRLEAGGDYFLSNAVIDGIYALRLCVVNFRTSLEDMERLPEVVARLGSELDGDLRPSSLA
jgi:glutamate/tyrosine decarboxylase-like PLP-dependent enzyme